MEIRPMPARCFIPQHPIPLASDEPEDDNRFRDWNRPQPEQLAWPQPEQLAWHEPVPPREPVRPKAARRRRQPKPSYRNPSHRSDRRSDRRSDQMSVRSRARSIIRRRSDTSSILSGQSIDTHISGISRSTDASFFRKRTRKRVIARRVAQHTPRTKPRRQVSDASSVSTTSTRRRKMPQGLIKRTRKTQPRLKPRRPGSVSGSVRSSVISRKTQLQIQELDEFLGITPAPIEIAPKIAPKIAPELPAELPPDEELEVDLLQDPNPRRRVSSPAVRQCRRRNRRKQKQQQQQLLLQLITEFESKKKPSRRRRAQSTTASRRSRSRSKI